MLDHQVSVEELYGDELVSSGVGRDRSDEGRGSCRRLQSFTGPCRNTGFAWSMKSRRVRVQLSRTGRNRRRSPTLPPETLIDQTRAQPPAPLSSGLLGRAPRAGLDISAVYDRCGEPLEVHEASQPSLLAKSSELRRSTISVA